MFSRLLIGKSEQTVLPFYPSSLPRCGFLVSLQMKPSVRHCKMKGMRVELAISEPIKDLTFWLITLLCQAHVYLKTLWNLEQLYLKDALIFPLQGKKEQSEVLLPNSLKHKFRVYFSNISGCKWQVWCWRKRVLRLLFILPFNVIEILSPILSLSKEQINASLLGKWEIKGDYWKFWTWKHPK